MKRTSLPAPLRRMLDEISYATIATVCPDGQPWNSPVVGRFDGSLNLYWVSWKESQHSRNIERDQRIFAVVYDSRVPEGQGTGLFLQMCARALVTPAAVKRGIKTYDPNFFEHPFSHQQFLGVCPQRLYKAVPQRIWYNVDSEQDGHVVDERRELMARAAEASALRRRDVWPGSCRG